MNPNDATTTAGSDTHAGFAGSVRVNRVAKPLTAQFITYLLMAADTAGFLLCYGLASRILTQHHFVILLTSRRVVVLMLITTVCLWLVDAFRLDGDEKLWNSISRFLGGLLLTACLFTAGVYLAGPELLGGNFDFLGRRTLLTGALAFALWGTLSRILVRRLQSLRATEARWLLLGSHEGSNLITFWRDFQAERGHGSLVLLTEPGVPLSLQTEDLPPIEGDWHALDGLLKEPWSGIIIASAMPPSVLHALMHARLNGMRVKTIEAFCDRHWQRVPVEYLRGEWFAFANGFALLLSPLQAKIKRASDVALAAFLFLVVAPPMLLVAALLKLYYRGPVLFTQPRVGRNGQVFNCFKFCTMRRIPIPGAGTCSRIFTCFQACTLCQPPGPGRDLHPHQ